MLWEIMSFGESPDNEIALEVGYISYSSFCDAGESRVILIV